SIHLLTRYCAGAPPDLRSFPTRRSSDLAIASQRSISNWVADFGSSEIGFTFDANEMGADPWTGMEKMWQQSPLKYACNARTPILDRKSTRLNSSHVSISYAVFCLKNKKD